MLRDALDLELKLNTEVSIDFAVRLIDFLSWFKIQDINNVVNSL